MLGFFLGGPEKKVKCKRPKVKKKKSGVRSQKSEVRRWMDKETKKQSNRGGKAKDKGELRGIVIKKLC